MAERALVSAVTGTWRRHELLMGAIESLRQQTYRPLEHVIVSDGQDAALRALIERVQAEAEATDPPIRFVELGRNWSTFLTNSMSAVPFQVAQWMARGEYHLWLADDERFTCPDAIAALVDALEAADADFAYPKVHVYWKNRPEKVWAIGEPTPRFGTVTHALHRADILDVPGGGFRPHTGKANDWDQFERWMAAGKRWAFLDRVTLTHRIDS